MRRLARGIEPQAVGALPRHLAALMQTNINVQGLTVEAALTGRREPVYHAAMLDPHTAAELPLDEIAELVDDLLEAHGDWIPPLAPGRSPARADGAGVCSIAPRRGRGSARMTSAPGPAVADNRDPSTRSSRERSDPAVARRPQGDQGHPVLTLQYLLRAHGQHIAVDGDLRPATEAAVRRSRRRAPGRRDRRPAHLVGVDRHGPARQPGRRRPRRPGGVPVPQPLRRPEPGLPVDGIFGPRPTPAVRGFQQALAVTVDGIVGPVTWRALVSGMLSF